jgi:hypothetical protein
MNPWIETLDSYLPVWMPSFVLAFVIMLAGCALWSQSAKIDGPWGPRLFGLGWLISFAGGGLGLLCGLIF